MNYDLLLQIKRARFSRPYQVKQMIYQRHIYFYGLFGQSQVSSAHFDDKR